MAHHRVLAAVGLLLLFAVSSSFAAAEAPAKIRKEVEDLHRALDKAINKRDASDAAKLFGKDAVMVSGLAGRFEGRKEIERAFEHMFAAMKGTDIEHRFAMEYVGSPAATEMKETFSTGQWTLRASGPKTVSPFFLHQGNDDKAKTDEIAEEGTFSTYSERRSCMPGDDDCDEDASFGRMKRRFTYAHCGVNRLGMHNERDDMLPFMSRYNKAVRHMIQDGECKPWADLFTEDAVIIPAGRDNPSIVGRKKIEQACEKMVKEYKKQGVHAMLEFPDAFGRAGRAAAPDASNKGGGAAQPHLYAEGLYTVLDKRGAVMEKGLSMKVMRREPNPAPPRWAGDTKTSSGEMRIASITWEPEEGIAERMTSAGDPARRSAGLFNFADHRRLATGLQA